MMRVALPFAPRALGPAGHVERVPALQHHAFDRLGIGAGAGRGRIGARGGELVPGRERKQRREIDARVVEPRDEALPAARAAGEGQRAQILAAFDQQIVGAQVRREFGQQLAFTVLRLSRCCSTLKRLHAALAHDQQLAVDRAVEVAAPR